MEKNKDLLNKLNALGFSLLEPEETDDVNAVLAEVAESGNPRFLESFPVLLANGVQREAFDYDKAKKYLKKSSDKQLLKSLVLMSVALYKVSGFKFAWAGRLYKDLTPGERQEADNFFNKFKKDEDFKLSNHSMSSQRLKATFNQYLSKSQTKLNSLLSVREEMGLEYALAQVFSPRQKELFLKKLKSEKLSKTEKEYFSRVVKKKVLALANPELHRLARELLY
jgi:hypothetical protein